MQRVLLTVLVCASCFASVWTLSPDWDVAQVKLSAGDAQAGDSFGRSVAISSDGTTVVVGAAGEDGGPGNPSVGAGAAYVLRLLTPGSGTWTQVAKLTASDAQSNDVFGVSVAVSGDGTTVVVGASQEDGGPGDPLDGVGAVYVFRLLSPGSGNWTQVAKLTADDAQSGGKFGTSVAVSSDGATVVVGATGEDGGSGFALSCTGAAYVFRLQTPGSGTWSQVAKLTANDAQAADQFGSSVGVSGDGTAVIVGATDEDGGAGDPLDFAGAAYVFRLAFPASDTWTQSAKLTADDAQPKDLFGSSVAIAGDGGTAVVGAHRESGGPGDPMLRAGAAYVFRRLSSSGAWMQDAKLGADDAQSNDYFGASVAVSGNGTAIVVGAIYEDGGPGDPLDRAGAAYVFRVSASGNGNWTQAAKLTADDAQSEDFFGLSVAISSDGTAVLVGARGEDGGSGDPLPDAGAAYLLSGNACPPGQAGNASDVCAPCGVGSSALGLPCSCDDGDYINGVQCVACPDFASRSSLAADDLTGCLCDRGYYNNGTLCAACPVFTSIPDSPIGATSLDECLCDRGYYLDSSECAVCPASTSIADSPVGATSVDECACDQGYYLDGSVCAACPTNTSIADSPAGATSVGECVCAQGYYHNGTACAACPASTSIADSPVGATSVDECACDQGYYLDGSVCAACPASTSIADSPAGATSVDECVCAQGYYHNGTACAACPAGYQLYGKGCEQVVCNSGEFYDDTDMTCQPCPLLTISEAGANTECHADGTAIASVAVPSILAILGAVAFVLHMRRGRGNVSSPDDGVNKPLT